MDRALFGIVHRAGCTQAGGSLGSVWPCLPTRRRRPSPERFSPLSVPGRLKGREIPRMSEAPPSVPRFGSGFGPVRGKTGASERFPASPRFPLGSPGVVSRISEARFSVQTWTVLHPRRTESIREARRSERFPVYSKGPPSITEGRRAPVSKVGPSQTCGFGYLGRRTPDEESVPARWTSRGE